MKNDKNELSVNTLENTSAWDLISEQHKIFLSIYMVNNNALKAAERCGVSRRTAWNWLQRDDVNKAMAEKRLEIQQRCEVTIDECLNELAKIAFFKHSDYASNFKVDPESGEIGVTLEEFNEIDTSAIQEMSCKINAQGIPYVVIKPYNKIEALKELLNRLEGTNGDKHVHLHLTPEEMSKMNSKETSSNYQQLVQNAMTK